MYQHNPYTTSSTVPTQNEINDTYQYMGFGYSVSEGNVTNTAINQSSNMYDLIYNSQMPYRNPNGNTTATNGSANMFTYCEQIDGSNWVPDIEKGLKLVDKMETIEITSKDLSPASCCSNVDLLLPDFYKGMNKDATFLNKMSDSQWYCNSGYSATKYNEYPSCAQINSSPGYQLNKTVKYCSIQKNEANFSSEYVNYNKQLVGEKYYNCEAGLDMCNYDLKQSETATNQQYFPPNQNICSNSTNYDHIQSFENQTEVSNEDSDIIVEESDEEVTDYSEDQEKSFNIGTTCAICNVMYTPIGNQFYFLTSKSPLTMSTQKPVFQKVKEILGTMIRKKNYLCSHCLGLINTIDHLQFKLDSCKLEISAKFEKTCKDNAINVSKKYTFNMKTNVNHKIRCKVCRKIFSLKIFYHRHIKWHRMRNRYLCDSCGMRFTKPKYFKAHLNKHKSVFKNPKIEAFSCAICTKLFRTKSNLKEHTNYCSNLLPFECKNSNCEKKFASVTKLKNHVRLKHDKKFSAICSICNIGFVKMSDYKSHKISHSTEKKYSCKQCDKTYKTLSNLNFHMKFHKDTLPYNCTICEKGFMRKEYLEAHLNIHNGIKNFACQVCDKKFVSQKNLDSHMKYHDGTIKKKTCNMCGKTFTTGFEEHLRTHNNLKEFECENCDMRFNTKGALSKHRKNKHSNCVKAK